MKFFISIIYESSLNDDLHLSVDDAYNFIATKFEDQNSRPKNQIYKHQTTATDTKLVEKVLIDVTDIILNQLLQVIGMN